VGLPTFAAGEFLPTAQPCAVANCVPAEASAAYARIILPEHGVVKTWALRGGKLRSSPPKAIVFREHLCVSAAAKEGKTYTT